MKKWITKALLLIFIYIPALLLIISGFSLFGLGIATLSGLLLYTNQEIRTYIHSKRGFQTRLSRLPLITEEPTQNTVIFLTFYLLPFSFICWLILGGSHTISLGIDILLSLVGIVLFYCYFVEGWFLPGRDQDVADDDKLGMKMAYYAYKGFKFSDIKAEAKSEVTRKVHKGLSGYKAKIKGGSARAKNRKQNSKEDTKVDFDILDNIIKKYIHSH